MAAMAKIVCSTSLFTAWNSLFKRLVNVYKVCLNIYRIKRLALAHS